MVSWQFLVVLANLLRRKQISKNQKDTKHRSRKRDSNHMVSKTQTLALASIYISPDSRGNGCCFVYTSDSILCKGKGQILL